MNSQKKTGIKGTVLLLLILSFGLNSCKKSNDANTAVKDGPARVIVNMLGIDETSEPLVAAKGPGNAKLASVNKTAGQAVYSERVQETVVPFNNDISIVATLVPEGGVPAGVPAKSSQNRISSTKSVAAAATPVQTPLAEGVKYQVLVYNDAGVFVASKEYAYGDEASVGAFALDAGQTYTFVAYSMNTTTPVPPTSVPGPLSSAALSGVNGDLMYFKKSLTLNYGDNNLDIVLKHQFSQITTNIALDASMTGNITAISGVKIGPMSASGNIMMGTGGLTYNMASPTTAGVVFPALGAGVRSISSNPTLIINPATANGVLTIASITIAGVMKTNLSFPNLNITPGVKYSLNLAILRGCSRSILLVNTAAPEFNMSSSTPPSNIQTYMYPYLANQGPFTRIVFYVTKLGNSFDISINGVHLISNSSNIDHEFRFDPGTGPSAPNVAFSASSGGGMYGAGAIPLIENLTNASTAPVFQIDITLSTGSVLLSGIKANNGPLFSGLTLQSLYHFNTINWDNTGSNTVTVSQTVSGTGTTFFAAKAGGLTAPCDL